MTIEGWKAIAAHVGKSQRWCRYMARPNDVKRPPGVDPDPMPVFKVGGMVRMTTEDYDAWIDRRKGAMPRLVVVDGIIATCEAKP